MPGKHHLRGFKIAKKSARRFAARGRCSASSLGQTPPWKKARSAPVTYTLSTCIARINSEHSHLNTIFPFSVIFIPFSRSALSAPTPDWDIFFFRVLFFFFLEHLSCLLRPPMEVTTHPPPPSIHFFFSSFLLSCRFFSSHLVSSLLFSLKISLLMYLVNNSYNSATDLLCGS